jgi:hypothetical protein
MRSQLGIGWAAVLLAQSVSFQHAHAQQSDLRTIVGTVLDAHTRQPVANALVLLDNGVSTETDTAGRFVLQDVPAGSYRLAGISRGCRIAVGSVDLSDRTAVAVRLEVLHPEDEGFPARVPDRSIGSRGSSMRVITAGDIKRMGGQTLLDVIRAAAPYMVGGRQSGSAGGAAPLSGRGNNSVVMPQTPVVIVDGYRIGDRPEIVLRDIDPGSVARIEILKGAASGWVHGEGAASGVIRVFTKKGAIPSDPRTEPRECGFSFEPRRP